MSYLTPDPIWYCFIMMMYYVHMLLCIKRTRHNLMHNKQWLWCNNTCNEFILRPKIYLFPKVSGISWHDHDLGFFHCHLYHLLSAATAPCIERKSLLCPSSNVTWCFLHSCPLCRMTRHWHRPWNPWQTTAHLLLANFQQDIDHSSDLLPSPKHLG